LACVGAAAAGLLWAVSQIGRLEDQDGRLERRGRYWLLRTPA